MRSNNTVYWITYGDYTEVPLVSDDWKNSFHLVKTSAIESIEEIRSDMKKTSPNKYAIVTDFTNITDKHLIHSKFISNNIVNITSKCDLEKLRKQLTWIFSNFGTDKPMTNDIFFCSDTHFGHKNIIQYCNRPWNSGKDQNGNLIISEDDVRRMDETLVEKWNSTVGEDSVIWHLGDFALGANQAERIPKLVQRLNGKINLVLGNHDHHPLSFYYNAGFNRVYDRPVIINNYCILSHTPMEFVKGPFFNIYGHVHSCSTYQTWSKDSCCVCVERHDYAPISWKEVEKHYNELNLE